MQAVKSQKSFDVTSLSDEQWFDAILKSVDENYRNLGDIQLPGYPDKELTTLTTVEGASENMLRQAFNLYKHIKEVCADNRNTLDADSKILDFGCGWGRISRFFTRETAMSNIHGVDVLPELVQACNDTYVSGNFLPIQQTGSLPYEENKFDLVFANSVFSHLDEKLNMQWVTEIARVLKPGGMAALTVIDENKFAKMGETNIAWFDSLGIDIEQANADLAAGKIVWQTTKRIGELEGYGLAITPISWVKENWNDDLKYTGIIEDYHQTIVILQKK